jgi:predicted nucleic acid-binding protein
MAGRVLTDASPLIGLARVNGLTWLGALFESVWVPDEVLREVLPGRSHPDDRLLALAFEQGILKRCGETPLEPALPELDEGEAACIRLALADEAPALLLMDERAGRALAIERGLRVTGTAAIIGMARMKGLIPSARTVFARLHASDFRISAQVIATILRRVGE